LISKDTWNEETDIVKRAAAWFYFVRLSVIGKGQAFGRGIASTFSPLPAALKVFGDIHDVIKNNNFILENLDLRLCATDYDHEETVHYFDVPYLKTDSGCYNHKFKEADMLETLNLISTLKGTVLFSHYPNELVEAQPFWTECHEWRVVLTSEVQAFTEENYRADKQSGMGHAIEKLWIKEHV
jgi:site-specific DNA-adenine methylase